MGNNMLRKIWFGLMITFSSVSGFANSSQPVCGTDKPPYRDFDFLVGSWKFFTMDGKEIGAQVYTKKEKGCLIQEDWSTIWGDTGTGINFVDPATNKWRQVWMSPSYHIDYSGGLNENGQFVLEGTIYPNDGKPASKIKGIYSKKKDGSVVKEFVVFDSKQKVWSQLFIGVAKRSM